MNHKIVFRISGMTCGLCSLKIENALEDLSGIQSIQVSYASEKASIGFDENVISPDEIGKQIEKLGFVASPVGEAGANDRFAAYRRKQNRFLLFTLVLSIPFFLIMILCGMNGCHRAFDPGAKTYFSQAAVYWYYKLEFLRDWRLQLLLATPLQFVCGARFYKNAFYAIKYRAASMDVLVALGTTVTYFYSLYLCISEYGQIYHRSTLYFEAGGTVIALVLLGKFLEEKARKRTGGLVDKLLSLVPETAVVLKDNTEQTIPVSEVQPGDSLSVKPGTRIPADGIVVSGESYVDESMLTGESMPVHKSMGNTVTGGTINQNGALVFTAEKVGEDTACAKIIRMVEESQTKKAAIQLLADKLCAWFVPMIVFISVLVFVYWYVFVFHSAPFFFKTALIRAVSVLVVSCPCALGLATPAALIVGIGMSARKGILVKSGDVFEKISKIDHIVFDKTGTLTEGKIRLSGMEPFGLWKDDDLIRLGAAAESKSEHPLAKAICLAAIAKGIYIPETELFRSYPGLGVTGILSSERLAAGRLCFLEREGFAMPDPEGYLESERKTSVYIGYRDFVIGRFTFEDTIRPGAVEAIDHLKKRGIKITLLTGDTAPAASEAATALGIDSILSGVLPEGKKEVIDSLRKSSRFVAMVGDGINDAPALAAADVGIAIGTGTDLAIETADVVFLNADPGNMPELLHHSVRTVRRIRINLLAAFLYNILLIPAAAQGNIDPTWSSAAMALSSVSVLVSSLLLRVDFGYQKGIVFPRVLLNRRKISRISEKKRLTQD